LRNIETTGIEKSMKRNLANATAGVNRLYRRVAADKKKTVLALSLIIVMVVMWIRLLSGNKPDAAKGTPPAAQSDTQGESGPYEKISFVELPKVPGRNDVITKDFFTLSSWQSFIKNEEDESLTGIQEVSVFTNDGSKEVITRVAQNLKLEAIFLADNPQAFINNKLLSLGDKLLIKNAGGTYEFEVIGIYEDFVLLRCGKAQITLKLVQAIDVVN
jgi:hypothetical protein